MEGYRLGDDDIGSNFNNMHLTAMKTLKSYHLFDLGGVMVSKYYKKHNYEMKYIFNNIHVLKTTVQYLEFDTLQTMTPHYLN